MAMNLKTQIEAAHVWRQQELAKTGGNQARIRRVKLDDLWVNQTHEMRSHLQHDNNHRMLDRFKGCPRSPHPTHREEIGK